MGELVSMTPVNIKPKLSRREFRELIQPLLKGDLEKLKFETIHGRKNGSSYPVEVHLQLSTIGENKVFVAMILILRSDKTTPKNSKNCR